MPEKEAIPIKRDLNSIDIYPVSPDEESSMQNQDVIPLSVQLVPVHKTHEYTQSTNNKLMKVLR